MDSNFEYFSAKFQVYLRYNGIVNPTSVELTLQSNGKAERLNRSLIEKSGTMIKSAQLEHYRIIYQSPILNCSIYPYIYKCLLFT